MGEETIAKQKQKQKMQEKKSRSKKGKQNKKNQTKQTKLNPETSFDNKKPSDLYCRTPYQVISKW